MEVARSELNSWLSNIIKEFGITRDIRKALFIMPDGRLIRGFEDNGKRILHNEIRMLFPGKLEKTFQRYVELFIRDTGACRFWITPKVIAVNLCSPLTKAQYDEIEYGLYLVPNTAIVIGVIKPDLEKDPNTITIERPTIKDVRRALCNHLEERSLIP